MYAPTHLSVWSRRSIQALARSGPLCVVRSVAGTEASLASWLATGRDRRLRARARDVALFGLRKLAPLGIPVFSDTSYYLQKSGGPGEER
jgi:hypothetical protein